MANIGSLTANLTLQSAAFVRDMNRAAQATASNTAKMRRSLRQVERASREVNRAFGQLRAGVIALGGALAVRQFSMFTRSALDSASATLDVANKVGLATKELQQLRFAAIQTGVAQNTLDMAMQRFSRRLGEVAQGQGELLKTAEQYDIQIRDSSGRMRANIDILKDFADVIKNAESQQERLRISFKLFDSEGAALVNTLRAGRVGLEAYMQQAVDFGAVMDAQVIAQAKLASDNLSALERIFKTAFDTSIIQEFAGQITLSGDAMMAVRQTGQAFGQVVGVAMRGVAEAARFAAEHMREIAAALAAIIAYKAGVIFTGIAIAVGKFVVALGKAVVGMRALNVAMLANPVGAVVGGITAAVAALAIFRNETVGIGETTVKVRTIINAAWFSVTTAIQGVVKWIKALAEAISLVTEGEFSKAVDSIQKSMLDLSLSTVAAVGAWSDLSQEFEGSEDVVARLENAFARLTQRTRELSAASAEAAPSVAGGGPIPPAFKPEDLEKLRQEQLKAAEAAARMTEQPFINAATNIQNAFTDTFEKIFSGGVDSFRDLAAEAKRIFIRMAAEMATLKLFGGSGLAGLVGGLGGAGGVANAGGSLSGLANIGGSSGLFGSLFAGNATAIGGTTTISASGPFAGTALAGKTVFASGGATGGLASLAGPLAGAGIGALAGNIIGGFFGGKGSTGGTLGGALGGGVGTAVGGPLGGVIGGLGGSLLGGLVGSLFGSAPDPRARALFGVSGGQLALAGVDTNRTGGRLVGRATDIGTRAAETLNSLVASLGGSITRLNESVSIFFRNNTLTTTVGGVNRGFGADADKALSDFIVRTLRVASFEGVSDVIQTVIRNTQATTLQQLQSDLEFGKVVDEFINPITELERSIRDVNMRFREMIDRAGQLGLSTNELVAAREREIQAVRLQARSPFLNAAGGIVDFLNQQSLGAGSSLSPVGRLSEAQRQFGGLLERVRGGEIGLAGNLTQSAGALLDIGRQNFASTVDFANLEGFVRSSLLSVAETLSSESFFDAQEATRQQTTILAESQDRTTEAVERLEREIALLRQEIADAA